MLELISFMSIMILKLESLYGVYYNFSFLRWLHLFVQCQHARCQGEVNALAHNIRRNNTSLLWDWDHIWMLWWRICLQDYLGPCFFSWLIAGYSQSLNNLCSLVRHVTGSLNQQKPFSPFKLLAYLFLSSLDPPSPPLIFHMYT